MIKAANLCPSGLYRFRLERIWDEHRAAVNFVMLNPSTADASTDDATIRKCIRLAEGWGHGGIIVTNLFAWRAVKPAELKALPPGSRGAGSQNDAFLAGAALHATMIVCAWGNDGTLAGRGAEVLAGLRKNGHAAKLHYLHLNKNGEPKHPLYCRDATEPTPYASAPSRDEIAGQPGKENQDANR